METEGFQQFFFPELGSTMAKAREISLEVKGPFVVRASRQTNGYGRKGAFWESPEGGLWFTAVFPARRLSGLSAFLALVVFKALREIFGDLKIKWPNDVVHFRRKVCGILTEVRERVFWGVGVNVNNGLSPELKEKAVSLKELTGKTLDLEEILRGILAELSFSLPVFEKEGFTFFRQEYERSLAFLGREVEVSFGEKILKGIADGINDEGFLKLITPAGPLLVLDGTLVKF
ncbi:MAG: biotin--[acetyl-CoA-carboxylase] ligase [Caldiserica bacterium]|jgi:BirA family biotin operon repressor/biotin-[acetyl-CoA-carboxylase] ligase|nr:biotin--[acetyl-CoA-carboxylase] ligase [Caldisericota bacterium]MDH7561815.1 biotin--[acetyl-CoA-carboxylase] ligase [Caldisericota bacterium]